MTKEQAEFLAKGTHVAITVKEHVKAWRRANKRDGDWPEDSVLNWDGTLLPVSSSLYIGRIYVRRVAA